MPIVFSSNNNYVPYMSTAIQSIMENSNSNREYIFFVLHKEIVSESMDLLKSQVSLFHNFSIEFINVSDLITKYTLFVSRHITVEAYFRFFIPEMLNEYQKAIYIDCDMVVCTDIAELFDIDLNNHLIAAMRDIDVINWYYGSKHSNKVKGFRNSLPLLKNPENYFCDGLCVFNTDIFSKTITTDSLFELAVSRDWDYHDQDVLNILLEGKVYFLSFHWGIYKPKGIQYLPENYRNEFLDAKTDPKIVHLVNKPWKQDFYTPHFELFWKYATRMPFLPIIINQMTPSIELSLQKKVLSYIAKRKIGLKFLLFDCIKAWIFRK